MIVAGFQLFEAGTVAAFAERAVEDLDLKSALAGVTIAFYAYIGFEDLTNLAEEAKAGRIPNFYHESDDPERRVPLVWKPDDYMVVVTGDLTRNSVYIFAHNGVLGFPVTKRIRLPKGWAGGSARSREL